MQIVARLILLVAGLSTLALPRFVPPLQAHPPAASAYVPLSRFDRQTGQAAAKLAGRSTIAALHWLRRQRRVRVARIDPDGATIEVHFKDGATVVILPSQQSGSPSPTGWLSLRRDQAAVTPGAASGKAIVLEPFATELGLGPDAGQAEADALSSAGFHVDILRNSDVTVKVMEGLAAYSVVYMQTHAHDYGGDVILSTGETDTTPYTAMFANQSVKQAFVAGDTNHLYNAVTSAFFTQYVGTFPNSSIVFINGCDVLGANILWNALQAKNVDTMIGWDNDVYSVANEKAGEYVLDHLAQGETVAADVADTRAAGLGTAWVSNVQANLGFLGDGNATLAAALSGATPVPTATTTPAVTPTPTPHPAKKHKKKSKKAKVKPTATPTPTPRPAKKKASSCKAGQHKVHGKCRPKHKKG